MLRVVVLVLALSACAGAGTVNNNDGGSVADAGDPCQGLGCAVSVGTVTLTVVDAATNQPVPGLQITTADAYAQINCKDTVDGGSSACAVWTLQEFNPPGPVTLSAPGYATQTVPINAVLTHACCGQSFEDTALTVMMQQQ